MAGIFPGGTRQRANPILRHQRAFIIRLPSGRARGNALQNSCETEEIEGDVPFYGPVEHYSLTDWQQTFATNVTGLFLCARAVLPFLRRRGGGHIIAISSGAGRRGYANLAAYSASKFAVIGFMESLAEEVGPDGIKCSTILPGSILTDFGPSTRAEKRASGKKYLDPEDVADAIHYLLTQPDHAWAQQINLWPF